ncbi:Short-chain dehydrogenase/reductase family protein [Mycena indigotica]|uniref:Short-chain dehydrogenase/reductase family protein n=1 Tax=Mycena indigotica TaxID=2126181 RepID=A0A8H6W446_9AGAR|nr:Short-chain dehydrogenase/reductase family protein [Mycena indigotica]KAF7298599.1 Short-chain dehydrogenase/reductase family protein [Mycena indigotica]
MSLPTFEFSTTAEEATAALASEIAGKNVLITGTTMKGIGFEAARTIAKYANLVVITGYNETRLQLSKEAIEKENPTAVIRPLILDLSTDASVRKSAAEVNAYLEPIHVLVNNAAYTDIVDKQTPDNLEVQMATGHINPFLFTKLILSKLLESTSGDWVPRVVFVSSSMHVLLNGAPTEKEELARGKGGGDNDAARGFMRYGEVKSANALTARELARKAGSKLRAFSLDPGAILTNLHQKPAVQPVLQTMGILDAEGNPLASQYTWKTLGQGAATTVVAAFDPRINDYSGSYLADCVVADQLVAPHSADDERAAKLWNMTEGIIGETFEI